MDQELRPSVGMDVIDDSDHLIGTVETVEHDHFVVQKGFIFPQNHRIPISAIDKVIENEVKLRISREMAQANNADVDWTNHPHYGESAPDSSATTRSAIRGGVDPRRSGT